MPYSVALVEGVQSSSRRGIAFLESESDDDVNGKEVFESLTAKLKNDVRSRFDYWLDGNTCDKYFHGWPNDQVRKGCFVFKWKRAGTYHRLYGFLFHPRPDERSFQACILVSHAQKNTEHTDASELEAVLRLKTSPQAIAAVKKAFKPKG